MSRSLPGFPLGWRGLPAVLGAALLAQFLAVPASALTCPYPARSVERMLASHDASSEEEFVAYGILLSIEPIPDFDHDIQSRPSFEARFEGYLARPSGFDIRAAFEASVTSSCIYHDACGSVPTGPDPALMLIREQEGEFVFHASVCNDNLLLRPTEEELERAVGCLGGATCRAP